MWSQAEEVTVSVTSCSASYPSTYCCWCLWSNGNRNVGQGCARHFDGSYSLILCHTPLSGRLSGSTRPAAWSQCCLRHGRNRREIDRMRYWQEWTYRSEDCRHGEESGRTMLIPSFCRGYTWRFGRCKRGMSSISISLHEFLIWSRLAVHEAVEYTRYLPSYYTLYFIGLPFSSRCTYLLSRKSTETFADTNSSFQIIERCCPLHHLLWPNTWTRYPSPAPPSEDPDNGIDITHRSCQLPAGGGKARCHHTSGARSRAWRGFIWRFRPDDVHNRCTSRCGHARAGCSKSDTRRWTAWCLSKKPSWRSNWCEAEEGWYDRRLKTIFTLYKTLEGANPEGLEKKISYVIVWLIQPLLPQVYIRLAAHCCDLGHCLLLYLEIESRDKIWWIHVGSQSWHIWWWMTWAVHRHCNHLFFDIASSLMWSEADQKDVADGLSKDDARHTSSRKLHESQITVILCIQRTV